MQMLAILGIPDFIGCLNGRFVAIELKRSQAEAEKNTGRIKLQKHVLSKIQRAGGVVFIAHPGNWEDIADELSLMVK